MLETEAQRGECKKSRIEPFNTIIIIYTSHIKLSTGLFTQGVDSSRQKALYFFFVFCYAAANDGISNSSV